MRQCVEESYQLRITELQIKGGQLKVPTPVDYQCGKSVTLSTYFYNEAKRPAAMINLSEGNNQQQVLAYETPSASGARYEGQTSPSGPRGATPCWSATVSPPSTATRIPGN